MARLLAGLFGWCRREAARAIHQYDFLRGQPAEFPVGRTSDDRHDDASARVGAPGGLYPASLMQNFPCP